jgi:DNA processing protein
MAAVPPAERDAPGLRVLSSGEPGYPAALHDLTDAPPRVWLRGEVPARGRCVAIVGSRAATSYGLGLARRLSSDLARLGIIVVSGLARGIDTAAHLGALEAGGATLAVLPFPLGEEPAAARPLARAIAARGALLSERAPGEPSFRHVFVERNRMIAALASAVVVVEAAERSGALSTAAAARRLGRPVLAVPGDVDRPTSAGTNELLRRGAALCASVADILPHVPAAASAGGGARGREKAGAPPAPDAAPAGAEARLAAALEPDAAPLERLAARAGVAPAEALAALLRLEWAGLAEARPGQRWRRGGSGA